MKSFLVLKIASEIQSLCKHEMEMLAEILASSEKGEQLADLIGFCLFDNDVVTNGVNSYSYTETQEA